MRAIAVAVVTAWLFLSGGPANAATSAKAEARELNLVGLAQFSRGEYEQAVAMFEHAYMLHHAPVLLFNIAECRRKLGEGEVAIRYYELYLDSNPFAKNREDVLRTKADLESMTSSLLVSPFVVIP